MRSMICYLVFLFGILAAPLAMAATLDRTGLMRTFDDEFDRFDWYKQSDFKQKPASGTWRTNLGYGWTTIDDVKNHTHGEEQIYVDPLYSGSGMKPLGLDPFNVKDGALSITAARTNDPALYGYQYTSGMITTQPSFTQLYGVFEMRAKLPKGRGLWPAFWMLPADTSWPPEIDIMEWLGHETTKYYTTLHTQMTGEHTKSALAPITIADASADFHTYAVDWGPQMTIFYFDGKEVSRQATYADMHKPFYLFINLAVGGNWPGSPDASTPLPAAMQIDWVRAWQRPEYVAKP